MNPYREKLNGLKGQDVTIDRAGASTLKGNLREVEELGCVMATEAPEGSHPDSSNFTFVAYKHIRGVSSVGWDYTKIHK